MSVMADIAKPSSPTHDQNVYRARTHFREKKG